MPLDNMPVMPTIRTEQIIDRAIELVARGWCQGGARSRSVRGQRSYCLLGAVNEASREAQRFDIIDVALKRIDQALPSRHGLINRVVARFNPRAAMVMRIASWNDNFRRTQDEVLAVMHNARNMHNAI